MVRETLEAVIDGKSGAEFVTFPEREQLECLLFHLIASRGASSGSPDDLLRSKQVLHRFQVEEMG